MSRGCFLSAKSKIKANIFVTVLILKKRMLLYIKSVIAVHFPQYGKAARQKAEEADG